MTVTVSCVDDTTMFTLSTGQFSVSVIEFGAAVVRMVSHGRDIVLGYDKVSEYKTNRAYFGAVIGRVANR